MRIIYNNDGSIKTLQLSKFITKGNDGVDTIYAEIEGRATNTYTAVAYFTLPDGTNNSLPGVIDGNGYKITLTSSQTTYAGILKMSLKLLDLQNNVLVTYNADLTINPSSTVLDSTNITQAEYETLIASLNSYVLKTELPFRKLYRHYIPMLDDVGGETNYTALLITTTPDKFISENAVINAIDNGKVLYQVLVNTTSTSIEFLEYTFGHFHIGGPIGYLDVDNDVIMEV